MRLNEFEMLPINAFRPRHGKFGPMTFEGGKDGGDAPAPDPNIGRAQQQLADLATEQWHEFRNNIYPELQKQTAAQNARLQGAYELSQEAARKNMERAD